MPRSGARRRPRGISIRASRRPWFSPGLPGDAPGILIRFVPLSKDVSGTVQKTWNPGRALQWETMQREEFFDLSIATVAPSEPSPGDADVVRILEPDRAAIGPRVEDGWFYKPCYVT